MRRNIFIKSKKGFSLVELCIVIGIMAVLAGSIAPVFIKRIQIKAGEKTAQEIAIIEQAGLSYFAANSAWPASLTVLKSAGYLNPSWTTNNPWQNPYAISSSASGFTVSTVVPQEWAGLVARDLPASSVSGTTIISSVPSPGTLQEDSLPIGSILIWSGTAASIPGKWHLCDGSSGTPDLRNRFLIGAGSSYGVGATGGATTHYHAGGSLATTFIGSGMPRGSSAPPGAVTRYAVDDNSGGGDSDMYSLNNISVVGNTAATSNMPPYYALCFIMKIE
jgi:prepilin-type N-terminal cleavage/methylation domain-containing protein